MVIETPVLWQHSNFTGSIGTLPVRIYIVSHSTRPSNYEPVDGLDIPNCTLSALSRGGKLAE